MGANEQADEDANQALRVEVCTTVSGALDHCGRVLWCFGLAEHPGRRAVGMVGQIAGELGQAATSLLAADSAYAAAALLRQVIETEYLFHLFATDLGEPERWLKASGEDLRKLFQPAPMRRRSGGAFRDQEYWTHCATGGHPHPHGAGMLLREHLFGSKDPDLVSRRWLWADMAQHLARVWDRFAAAAIAHALVNDIVVVRENVRDIPPLLERWRRLDGFANKQPP